MRPRPAMWFSSPNCWFHTGTSVVFTCTSPLPPGNGNIDADPLFVNYAGGDYRLADGSPCIDRGTNDSWMAERLDLDGNPRIRSAVADMGDYEAARVGASTPTSTRTASPIGRRST